MLNLSNNKIKSIDGIDHLNQLAFLDLSHNLIDKFTPDKELPKNVMIARLNNNPVEKDDAEYRKKIVLACEYLNELDKIKVVAAERFVYKGLLPAS